jgi:hypothetical protein
VSSGLPDSIIIPASGILVAAAIGIAFAHISGVAATIRRSIPPWIPKERAVWRFWLPCLKALEHLCWAVFGVCLVVAILLFAGCFWSVL